MIPVIPNKFAQFITQTNYDSLLLDVAKIAEGRIIDILGAALAGACNWEYKNNFLEACRKLGSGNTAVFTGGRREFPLSRVAMINTTFAHVIELDDGHKNAGVHCGAAVIPLALTLGNALNLSGKEIITAIVIGYDIVYRLASCMTPYQTQKGFHPSRNDNTIGCMAVAGKLLNLNKSQLENVLGLSALYASELMEAKNNRKIPCVYMHVGTSKALFFRDEDLPQDISEREKVILNAFGSLDRRQIDGMGGANTSTSKVAIIKKSDRPGIDIDYDFSSS